MRRMLSVQSALKARDARVELHVSIVSRPP